MTKLSTTALCSFSSLSVIHREVDEEEGPFNGREFMHILHYKLSKIKIKEVGGEGAVDE